MSYLCFTLATATSVQFPGEIYRENPSLSRGAWLAENYHPRRSFLPTDGITIRVDT